jgi:hypothetical protein
MKTLIAYLKRFNKKIIKVKDLFELSTEDALFNRVYDSFLWKHLYDFLDKTLIKVKQVMKNHIRMK